ncbi:MoaD/ThiS family protein [Hydrogenimonas sp. SS33]|uniref:MoaD/ThiS family protein n=1 Tax=Hydrogenimonas leucolamina TaxID=2954236 RepID=UPI00336C2E65
MSKVKVEFLGPIGKPPMEVDAQTLADVAKLLGEDAELKKWLQQCAVAVNDEMVTDLNLSLKEGDRISLLPPVCGG